MKPTLHPLAVLIGVLVLGIAVWPMLQKSGSIPKGTIPDGIAVIVLVGGYYLYKRWYESERGSVASNDRHDGKDKG